MSDSELQSLKADFLAWTGGFEPEAEEDIVTYIEASMSVALNPEEARDALREWMKESLST